MYDLYIMLLDSVCQNLLRIFASMLISDIGLQLWFLVESLSGFGIRVMVASQNEFESLPSSAIFWKSLGRIAVGSSLNFWQNFPVKPSGPGLLFVGRFLITVSISILVLGLLRFSGSVLEGYTFLRIRPFLPSCPFDWHLVAYGSLL